MFIELLAAANDVLEVVARKKKAERFVKEFGEGTVLRVDVGTILIPQVIYDYLNSFGVWAMLEEGGKKYQELKRLRMM